MKTSIRTKFTLGILFFFVIILVLSVFSAYYLNKLSTKTGAILIENHTSVTYARNMSEGLSNINLEISNSYLTSRNPDGSSINRELILFAKSLQLEKNTITEVGEDQLVANIETGFNEYRDSVLKLVRSPKSVADLVNLETKYGHLYQQLMLLSQINEKAIEHKTDDAKISAKSALTQMTILGTLCFLIALTFTYNFASYFSGRFFQLYKGIKEIVASNYGQRLHFEGNDEFHDISLVFNEMAGKLEKSQQNLGMEFQDHPEKDYNFNDVQEVKKLLARLKNIEEQSLQLITRLEKKG